MFGYIVRRLISAFFVVVLTSMFVFALFFYGQSNVASNYCQNNGHCTAQKQQQITHELGLDQSGLSQYAVWAKGIFVGRTIQMGATYECPAPCFGISYRTQENVWDQIKRYLPATLSIAVGGATLYLFLGLVLGSLAARWRATFADKALVTGSLLVSSIPYFLVVLLGYIYFVLVWAIVPQPNYVSPFTSPASWVGGMLLAWLILGITGSTNYARFTRGFMIDSLGEDYVRTATAKGVSRNKAIFKHALRVAVVPVITLFGIDFAYLLSGAVVTEYILQINGIGVLSLLAINQQDFPVIQATVLIGAVFIVIANLLVDVLYSVLDPRVRLV